MTIHLRYIIMNKTNLTSLYQSPKELITPKTTVNNFFDTKNKHSSAKLKKCVNVFFTENEKQMSVPLIQVKRFFFLILPLA